MSETRTGILTTLRNRIFRRNRTPLDVKVGDILAVSRSKTGRQVIVTKLEDGDVTLNGGEGDPRSGIPVTTVLPFNRQGIYRASLVNGWDEHKIPRDKVTKGRFKVVDHDDNSFVS